MTETKESRSFLSWFKGRFFFNTTKPAIFLTSGLIFQATLLAVPTPSSGVAPSYWASISSTPPVSSFSPSVGLSTGGSRTPSTHPGRPSMWSVCSPYYTLNQWEQILYIYFYGSSSDSAPVILRSAYCSDGRQSHLRKCSGCPQSSHQVL